MERNYKNSRPTAWAAFRTALAVLCLCLIFGGCSASSVPDLLPDPPQIPQSFTCEIQFVMDGLEGAAHLERPGRSEELQTPSEAPLNAGSGLELCLLAPKTLEGITLLYLDGMVRIEAEGVKADFLTVPDGQGTALPDNALLSVLAKALDQASGSARQKERWTCEGDGWIFTGTLLNNSSDSSQQESGRFRLAVSGDGAPVSLAADDAGISVQFSQVSPEVPVL